MGKSNQILCVVGDITFRMRSLISEKTRPPKSQIESVRAFFEFTLKNTNVPGNKQVRRQRLNGYRVDLFPRTERVHCSNFVLQ